MKILKRLTTAVLVMAMVVTVCGINPTKTDAAVKILTGKKITLSIGGSDYIVSSPKSATYKTSNKKIATVSKKGVVKAKKAGTAKITVKTSSGSAKVTVNVRPKKVTISSATLTSTTSAKVKWKKSSGAAGYYVYYSTKKSSGFKKVKVKGGKKTSTTIKNLALGNTYYFKVKAYAKAGKKTVTSAAYSKLKTVKTWKMVFNDEFSATTLDRSKWDFQTGGGGYGNNELQVYTDGNNMEMKNGNLVIEPEFKYDTSTKRAVKDSYTSTKIWTQNKHSFKYGRIEFRAKLPKGQGTWAAAWMLGDNYSWPACGEIDVLETTSQLQKTLIPQSIHCPRFNGMSTSSGNKYKSTVVSTATSEYHTYGIEWTNSKIIFNIDGHTTWTYDPSVYSLDGKGTNDNNIWPYNQPFYLILNCAIGGVLGGDVGPTYWTKTATNGNIETYRDYYYIDWVRVYQ